MVFAAIMSETGEVLTDKDNSNNRKTLMILMTLMKNLLFYTLKSIGLAVVIYLERELFKIALLVLVLYLVWVVLSFTDQVVLRTLLPCL